MQTGIFNLNAQLSPHSVVHNFSILASKPRTVAHRTYVGLCGTEAATTTLPVSLITKMFSTELIGLSISYKVFCDELSTSVHEIWFSKNIRSAGFSLSFPHFNRLKKYPR